MNKFYRLICVILSAVILFAAMTACKKRGNEDSASDGSGESSSEDIKENDSNHNFAYTETDKYLLKDGATEYTVVTPRSDVTEMSYAKTELITIFKEATGVALESRYDEGLTHTTDGKYISLGNTSLYRSSGLNLDLTSIKEDGVRIVTKDNTIYILGGSERGVLYAVYDFLNMNFGFETYYKDCYTLDKNVKNLKLMNYDVTDIPDIDYRGRTTGVMYSTTSDYGDIMYSYRLRSTDASWMRSLPIHSGSDKTSPSNADHNCFYYLPREQYEEDYPEFYSPVNVKGGQLCYTAHGDKEKFDLMTDLCAEKIEQSLTFYPREQYPLYTSAQLGIADNYDTCTCAACEEIMSRHNNAVSATIIIFMKEVAKKVNAWMELPENADYKRENFTYTFFAYYDALTPPFTYNESTGKYEASSNEVLPEGLNVVPFYAINKMDHALSIYDDGNKNMRESLEAWLAYYSNAWAWTYGCFYLDYFAFYDCYNFYADAYAFFKEHNFKMVVPQLHSSQRGADTGFFQMAAYIMSKLAWNSSLDMQTLIEDYMNAMFKEAAEPMMKVFKEARVWHAKEHLDNSWTYSAWTLNVTGTKGYFTIGYVKNLLSYFDEAYAAIEKYKGDETTYNTLRRHINVEWLYPALVAINNFEDSFAAVDYNAMKAKFKTICSEEGMVCSGERIDISSILKDM